MVNPNPDHDLEEENEPLPEDVQPGPGELIETIPGEEVQRPDKVPAGAG